MSFFLVMKAEIIRSFIIMRRYWFQTVIGMVVGYGMLLMLILGYYYSRPTLEATMRNRFDDPVAAVNFVLGFIIGLFAFGIVGMFSQGLQSLARTGVLEQLCLSPHGLITNFLARAVVGSVSSVMSSAIMVYLIAATVKVWSGSDQPMLHFEAGPVLVLLALTFCNLLGFGFMVGGLVLIFKQVGQVAILVRMGLFALAMIASENLLEQNIVMMAIMHALPITDATICLKLVLIKGYGSNIFAHSSFYFLIANCIAWTVLGMACFRIMENWSRSKGTLGAY